MKKYRYLMTTFTLLLFASQTQAVNGEGQEAWQLRRLMQPTQDELQTERAGEVMIYDGLTDRQVSLAMDHHFNRIQAMMFTGTVITDRNGAPKADPDTGEILTENDGCD